MIALTRRLTEACGTGEILCVIYYGGTQPGSRRDLIIRAVHGGYVEAVCLTTHVRKLYRVDKMELWQPGATAPIYEAHPRVSPTFATFHDLALEIVPRLARPEWHVEYSAGAIEVREKFKNGRSKKSAIAGIRQNSTFDGGISFSVFGRWRTRTFRHLERAGAAFLAELGLDPVPADSTTSEPRVVHPVPLSYRPDTPPPVPPSTSLLARISRAFGWR